MKNKKILALMAALMALMIAATACASKPKEDNTLNNTEVEQNETTGETETETEEDVETDADADVDTEEQTEDGEQEESDPTEVVTPAAKPETETKPEVKPETKPETKPQTETPAVKPETTPEVKPEVKPETPEVVAPETKPETETPAAGKTTFEIYEALAKAELGGRAMGDATSMAVDMYGFDESIVSDYTFQLTQMSPGMSEIFIAKTSDTAAMKTILEARLETMRTEKAFYQGDIDAVDAAEIFIKGDYIMLYCADDLEAAPKAQELFNSLVG